MDFQDSIEINASPEHIWEVLIDVEHWPEWTESMESVRKLDPGELRVGSKIAIVQPKVPPLTWTVTSIDPGKSFSWEADVRGVHSRATHAIEPNGGSSTVTLGVHQTGVPTKLFGWYLRRISAKYVPMEARGLKQRAESNG